MAAVAGFVSSYRVRWSPLFAESTKAAIISLDHQQDAPIERSMLTPKLVCSSE